MESRIAVRQDLFRQVLILDKARIFSRLRSRHAAVTRKTKGKPTLSALLSRSVNDPSIKPRGKLAKARLVEVRSQVNRFSDAFEKAETAHDDQTSSSLFIDSMEDLLVQAYEFDTEKLRIVLQTSSSIDPTLKTFLPQAVSKLGRYYCITCDLVNAARSSQYTLFRRISIEALEEHVLDTAFAADGSIDFDEVLRRLNGLSPQRPHWQHLSGSLPLARTKFQSRISNHLTPWKVHAEIQLLFYYEHNPDIPHPRIICSSKSACYLCDLFIRLHGKFHIPRTHGRLYDRWILPEPPNDQSPASEPTFLLIERFNLVLEAKILQTLNNIRLPRRHPNESVLHLREPWSSTSTISQTEPGQTTVNPLDSTYYNTLGERQEEPSSEPPNSAKPNSPYTTTPDNTTYATQEPSALQETLNPQRSSHERQASATSSTPNPTTQHLSQGETSYHQLTRSNATVTVLTAGISLHLSWDWPRAEPTNAITAAARDSCWVQVTSLAPGPLSPAGDEMSEPIDLDTLGVSQDKTVPDGSAFGSRPLGIRTGRLRHTLVVLRYSFEDPRRGGKLDGAGVVS